MITAANSPRSSKSRRSTERETTTNDRPLPAASTGGGGASGGASGGGGAVIIRPGMMIRDSREEDAFGHVVEVYDHQCVYANSRGERVGAAWEFVTACAVQPELPAGYVMNIQEATADPYYRMSNELLVFMNRVEHQLGRDNETPVVIEHLEAAFGVLMNLSNDHRGPWLSGDMRNPSMDAETEDDQGE